MKHTKHGTDHLELLLYRISPRPRCPVWSGKALNAHIVAANQRPRGTLVAQVSSRALAWLDCLPSYSFPDIGLPKVRALLLLLPLLVPFILILILLARHLCPEIIPHLSQLFSLDTKLFREHTQTLDEFFIRLGSQRLGLVVDHPDPWVFGFLSYQILRDFLIRLDLELEC